MAKVKDGKDITKQEDIDYILSLDEEKLTISCLMELFGNFNGKTKYSPQDYITIPAGYYVLSNDKKNDKPIKTTVGIWCFNRLCLQNELSHIFGYLNNTINGKTFKKINKILSRARLEEEITLDALKHYLLKTQLLMRMVSILSPNYSVEMLTITEKIDKRKMELVNKYRKELQARDVVIGSKIEKELLDYARELLKDDDSMDIYNSGARCSFDNNFKNMFVMKGPTLSTKPNGGFNIALSNYMDGISADELYIIADSLTSGSYARARKTEIGGYWEKLFVSAFQYMTLGKPGSDCGTKRYVTVTLTEDNIDDWIYSYVIQGSKLIELTSKNIDSFIGKTVKMRFSSMCEAEHICEKCSGTLFRRLGFENAGILLSVIPATLKQKQMKAFHDGTVSIDVIDPMKAFSVS